MTVQFTTTQQKVVFTDTDGAVTFTATQPPVVFTAAVSGPQGPPGADGATTHPRDFVYSPSGTQAGIVFTDWNDLYAAVVAAGPGPKSITFTEDCTLSPATPTTYDLSDVTLHGNDVGYTTDPVSTVWVKLGNNFYLDDSMLSLTIDRGLTLESISSDYIISPTGPFVVTVDSGATIGTTTQAIIYFAVDFAVCAIATQANAGNSYIVGVGGENLVGIAGPAPLGGYELVESAGNAIIALSALGYSVWPNLGTVRGECLILVQNLATPSAWTTDFTGAAISPFHSMTNPNLTISYTTLLNTTAAAEAVEYAGISGGTWTTTAVGTEWATGYPESVMDAIDRLAAAVAGLLGSPIP